MSVMAKRMVVCLSIGLMAMFAAACGDDGGGGGGGGNNGGGGGSFDSSVDESKQVDEMSADEKQTMCSEYESYAQAQFSEQELANWSCTFAGILGASFQNPESDDQLQQMCAATRDQCLQEGESSDDTAGSGVCDLPDNCTATVAEIETCTDARIAQFKAAMAATPECEEVTLADLQDDGNDDTINISEPPAECQPVQDKCPGYFDDDSEQM